MRFFQRFMLVCLLSLSSISAICAEEPAKLDIPNVTEVPSWFKESFLNFRDDVADAAASNKRLMVFFGQNGCPYCKELIQVNFSQKDIVDDFRKHFDAIALNMWGDRETTWIDGKKRTEKELAAFLKVQFTPTLLFLDEKGNVVLRLNGYYPPHKFRVALDYVSKKMEDKIKFADYMRSVSPVPSSGKLHDEPFFMKPPLNFKQTRISAKKPLAVVFEQRDCAPCDELHKGPFLDVEILDLLDKFKVAQVNIFGHDKLVKPDGKTTTEDEWARQLKVAYTPSIVFFDEHGKEVFRIDAYMKRFHIAAALDYVASKGYLRQPSFQRFVEERADKIRQNGGAIELWK